MVLMSIFIFSGTAGGQGNGTTHYWWCVRRQHQAHTLHVPGAQDAADPARKRYYYRIYQAG